MSDFCQVHGFSFSGTLGCVDTTILGFAPLNAKEHMQMDILHYPSVRMRKGYSSQFVCLSVSLSVIHLLVPLAIEMIEMMCIHCLV